MTSPARALADLQQLVSYGPRFHGDPGIRAAADWLESELVAAGLALARQSVRLPGWRPGTVSQVTVVDPLIRTLPAWPMLGSGGAEGTVGGRVKQLGPQGLWGDSQTWQRFVVLGGDGRAVAYLHGRDDGPASPQPLPAGSDAQLPHLAIGHLDARQLTEWIRDDRHPSVEVACDAHRGGDAVGDNLIVDVSGTGDGRALLCGHYDTFFNTVGAYDNGSGTIALLQLLREWTRTPPVRSVRVVFFTAEEWHLGGSRHYVAQADAADALAPGSPDGIADLDFVLNIDGLGRGSFLEAFASPETFDTALHESIVEHAAASRPDLTVVSRFPPTTGTDDASFYRAGVPSAFLTFNDLHRLHQPDDLPNEGIAGNVAWTVGLARRLVDTLPRADRFARPGIL
ncbi:M20/M25/M40 family metallo-hydrolase [Microbacterium sp. 18062]|uniref:M20/M25/M40 family metallo-hydrolase n=1 Tax=Microbacterium sp. 18062 TaxID=2681410 RepID=UPI00135B1F25|nr:M20/M25/M40 family metallo-hydrolase [Microbacterium sp. 18062]